MQNMYKVDMKISTFIFLTDIVMRHVVCGYCWKEFDTNTNKKYCSEECSKLKHYEQNAKRWREKRKKIYICKKCWAEFETHSWRNSYCDNCKRRKCPRKVICWECWKEFECKTNAKYCSKECSNKAHIKKISARNKAKIAREHKCLICWNIFPTRQWINIYCDDCIKERSICPECWNKKSSDHIRCVKCQNLSHTYICTICWKECVWPWNSLYCDNCYPKCKVCWKKVNTPHNWCCSISCATIYKWRVTSWEKMSQHLLDMISWKYNNGNRSTPNSEREQFFIDNWIKYFKEFKIKNTLNDFDQAYAYFDFKIWNTLIEVNPSFSHNSTMPYRWNKIKPYNYHNRKTELWIKNGYNVINIFDRNIWTEFNDWLLSELREKEIVSQWEIKEINKDEAKKFIYDNYPWYVIDNEIVVPNEWDITYWVYKWNELVFIMWFEYLHWLDDIYYINMSVYLSKKWYEIKWLDKEILQKVIEDSKKSDLENWTTEEDRYKDLLITADNYDLSICNWKKIKDLWFYESWTIKHCIYVDTKNSIITKMWYEDYYHPVYWENTRTKKWFLEVYTAWEKSFVFDKTLLM